MVHVSNFRPVKRPVDCVEILARVLKKTKARLVMVGDGSERTNCVHRAKCLGVSDQCVFVGKQPNIVDYLCASDVLLLPSEQESFGLAALEAMAVQVPVIASRVGGLPDVVDDGETGFLSGVGDVDKMADDAARLLSDPKLRREMGKRARQSAIDRYSTHKVIPKYIEFYETNPGSKIIAGRKPIIERAGITRRVRLMKRNAPMMLISTNAANRMASTIMAMLPEVSVRVMVS